MSDSKDEGSDTAAGLQWDPSIDKMIAGWCDEAKAFEWMNTEAYSRYSTRSTAMSITTNAVIALSGIANFVVGNVSQQSGNAPMILGSVSIVISIVSMLQDKFDWLTLANNFKNSSRSWGSIARKIEEQLAVPPAGRKDCGTFLKYIKQDINAVSEHNSNLPEDIRVACMNKFGKIKDFDIPDICGGIEHTPIYVEPLQLPLLTNTNTNGQVGVLYAPKPA